MIIGAPYSVTSAFIKKYRIYKVLHGTSPCSLDIDGTDPYAVPKSLNIYEQIETSFSYLTTKMIIDRIIEQRAMYEERNRKKEAKEIAMLKMVAENNKK